LNARQLTQFEKLFRELFKPLCGFALRYVPDADEAKGIVHDVFVHLWERFETLPADTNHRSYLYTAVRNRCLNYLRDRKKTVALDTIANQQTAPEESALETEQLSQEIDWAIQQLPERCREVFELNRFGGLKYIQIAEKLGISVKTVETQMTKALSHLRTHLAKYLSLLIFLWTT
jgi:RNA polymerase sigma-70 factor (ECF subfamily)